MNGGGRPGFPRRQEKIVGERKKKPLSISAMAKKKTLTLPWSRNLTFDDDSGVFVRAWVGPVPHRHAGNGAREGVGEGGVPGRWTPSTRV